ncbi:hypothetical protein [Bacillus tropicus]|nr:hypothetical protein [Bacillus tropicus]
MKNYYEDVQEQYETLAIKFYDENEHSEASKYFLWHYKQRKKQMLKED